MIRAFMKNQELASSLMVKDWMFSLKISKGYPFTTFIQLCAGISSQGTKTRKKKHLAWKETNLSLFEDMTLHIENVKESTNNE